MSSSDIERALSVASRIRAGVLTINGSSWYGPASPFGGFKQSGVGRQNEFEGFEQYTETKTYGLPA